MATLGDLIVNLSANSASFQSEMARATRLGGDFGRTMEQGNRRAESAARQSQRALVDLNGQLATVRSSALSMVGAFAGAFATGNLIAIADKWNSLSARVKLATTSTEDFGIAQSGLMQISQYTGSTFESNAALFSRASSSLREYGYTTKDILSLTDSLATGLQVSGASADETASLITQLSQALGRGVLRGQDFNSVAQSGQRIMKALADGLGVAQKDLKGLADAGELTTPKIVPALISQLGQLRKEFETMPNSVSAASTRINNAFMEWVGGQNNAAGITTTLAAALDGLAHNIDGVATGLGVLVGVGVVRYFGNMAQGMMTATGSMLAAQRAEIAVAAAQVEGARAATAAARATLYRAQQAKAAAVGIEAQIVAERQLAIAQRQVSASVAARTAAQGGLNAVTSLGARLGSGLLSAVGGIPGVVLGIGAAWYYTHQKNEQARKTALAYGNTVEQVRKQISDMSIAGLQSTAVDAGKSISAQRTEIAKTEEEIRKLKDSLSALKKMEVDAKESPWMSRINTLMSLNDIQEEITEAQGRLSKKSYELEQQTEKLRSTESLRTQALNESINKTAAMAGAVGGLTEMYAQLNKVTGLSTAAAAPKFAGLALPKLDEKQQTAMTRALRDQQLASLKGVEKVRMQATFEADDLNLPPGRYEAYIAAKVGAERQTEALTVATKAQQKAEQDAASAGKKSASVAADYQQKIANLNKEIQIEGVRLKEGDTAATLFAASLEAGTKWTSQQRAELIQMNKALAEAKQRWEDHNAAIASDPYRAAADTQKKASEQLQRQIADGEIKSAEELSRRKQDINTAYLQAKAEADQRYAVSGTAELAGEVDPVQNIENQLKKRQALIESYAAAGVLTEQRKNELILASEKESMEQRKQAALELYAAQGDMQKMAVDLFQTAKERAGNMLTGLLTDTQTFREGVTNLFASLTQSIVQNLIDMAAQALITSSIMQTITGVMGSLGGLTGGIGGAASGAASGAAGAASSASTGAMGMSTSFRAYDLGGFTGQGGKYEPAGVVHKGEFVFTKEATERIGIDNLYGMMRGYADGGLVSASPVAAGGSLGIRPTTAKQQIGASLGSSAPIVYITVESNGQTTSSAPPGMEQFGREIGTFVDQRFKVLLQKEMGQGRILNTAMKGGRS
ncbi:tape measure protein [Serratia fonticola]|uniref:tape measure protein n=1 Tax=Serratia fonticola TaxID=47917 RepID=UPI00157563A4|nr:tape measure protein [Serratia fonticola]NTY85569.1 tape measure protein [Serratia fonticola]NTZ11588.1 tape measure protein [Serratia fonticola]